MTQNALIGMWMVAGNGMYGQIRGVCPEGYILRLVRPGDEQDFSQVMTPDDVYNFRFFDDRDAADQYAASFTKEPEKEMQ